MKKLTIALLAAAVAASGAIFAFGQTEGTKRQGHHGFRHGKSDRRGGMMGRMLFRKLDLTDEQKEQLKAIRLESREGTKSLRQELRATRHEIAELGSNGTLDEALLDQLATKQAGLVKQMTVEAQKTNFKMLSVLTPEQKTKLDEMKASFKEKMQERMEKRKARFGDKKADS